MTMQPTWQAIPTELQNLTAPTRADAIAHLDSGHGWQAPQPSRFEDTKRGKECAGSKWGQDFCVAEREKFDRVREQGIESSMIALTRQYDENVARRQRIEANNAQVLERETQTLRDRYMAIPGATEESFQKELPGLLEARRREAALSGQSAVERMADQMRPKISL